MVLVQYDYDQNIDKAYDDLKKKLDGIKSDLPDDVDTPTIIEMDINSTRPSPSQSTMTAWITSITT